LLSDYEEHFKQAPGDQLLEILGHSSKDVKFTLEALQKLRPRCEQELIIKNWPKVVKTKWADPVRQLVGKLMSEDILGCESSDKYTQLD
jgi:hypothetical protein